MTESSELKFLREVLRERFDKVIKNNQIALAEIKKIENDYESFPHINCIEFNDESSTLFKSLKDLFEEKFKHLKCESQEFKKMFGDLNFKQAFCYSYFTDKQYRCCFCGQLLEISKKNDKEFVHADIEHILPKSKYPQFALHPDNFAPACKECNQGEKGDKFFDTFDEFKKALSQLNVNLTDKPLKLWKNYSFDFSKLSKTKLKLNYLNKESEGYKLIEYYGIPKRADIIISHCYDILFNIIKHSDIRSPASLERLLENMASSNWHELNDGYSINNSPQIWQEFLEWILYSESNLVALWEEVKDYSRNVNNYLIT